MPSQTPSGYNGRILRIDLSLESTSIEYLDELSCRKYIGGAGSIAYYLLRELKQRTDGVFTHPNPIC